MFPYRKTLKLFIHFLLSISISGDSSSDFLDMKMLIGSVTYLKQHFIRQDYLSQLGVHQSPSNVSSTLQYIQYQGLYQM